jgi:hypothetical protein
MEIMEEQTFDSDESREDDDDNENNDEDTRPAQLRKRACTSADNRTTTKSNSSSTTILVNWESTCVHMILRERDRRFNMKLMNLIETGLWDLVRNRFKTNPNEFTLIHPETGKTPLHELCAKPNAPPDIIERAAINFPQATKMRDRTRFQSTPLHLLCLNSQRTFRKVQSVVDVMNPHDLLLGNSEGDTALHLACAHNACFSVLEILIRANPGLLLARNHQQRTAFAYLRRNYFQSIPGHMAMTRILNDREVRREGHFDRFWQKVSFYAIETLKYLDLVPRDYEEMTKDNDDDSYMLLGLLHLEDPRLTTLQVVLKCRPDLAGKADKEGNYPLHYAVRNQYFGGGRDAQWIRLLIEAYPPAAVSPDQDGNIPLMIGIRGQLKWDQGLGLLVHASRQVLSGLDPQTRLYPFLLAATCTEGPEAVNNAYQMLLAQPDLVQGALSNNYSS